MDDAPTPSPDQELQAAAKRFSVSLSAALNDLIAYVAVVVRGFSDKLALIAPPFIMPMPDEGRAGSLKPPRKAAPRRYWTPEREDLLRRLYGESVSVKDILAQVNALPGAPISSPKAVLGHAADRLGLRRPPGWGNETLAKARAAQQAARRSAQAAPPHSPAPRQAAPVSQVTKAAPTAPVPPIVPAPTQFARPLPAELAPNANGFVVASFADIRDWAERFCIRYDGTNIDLVNKMRARLHRPPFSQEGP